jgi:hypothetical protein
MNQDQSARQQQPGSAQSQGHEYNYVFDRMSPNGRWDISVASQYNPRFNGTYRFAQRLCSTEIPTMRPILYSWLHRRHVLMSWRSRK